MQVNIIFVRKVNIKQSSKRILAFIGKSFIVFRVYDVIRYS